MFIASMVILIVQVQLVLYIVMFVVPFILDAVEPKPNTTQI